MSGLGQDAGVLVGVGHEVDLEAGAIAHVSNRVYLSKALDARKATYPLSIPARSFKV